MILGRSKNLKVARAHWARALSLCICSLVFRKIAVSRRSSRNFPGLQGRKDVSYSVCCLGCSSAVAYG